MALPGACRAVSPWGRAGLSALLSVYVIAGNAIEAAEEDIRGITPKGVTPNGVMNGSDVALESGLPGAAKEQPVVRGCQKQKGRDEPGLLSLWCCQTT